MTTNDVQEILKKLGTDPEFRERMSKNPLSTMDQDFPNKLDDAEKSMLKDMAEGYAFDIKKKEGSWWLPTSFKDFGGAILSLVLVILLFWIISQVYRQIAALPQVVPIGDTNLVVNTYDRAVALLNTLFPLFSAVVSFWLGVAVEGKRADENQKTAEIESGERAAAVARERMTKAIAASTIGTAKGLAIGMMSRSRIAGQDTTELDVLIHNLAEGEEAILG